MDNLNVYLILLAGMVFVFLAILFPPLSISFLIIGVILIIAWVSIYAVSKTNERKMIEAEDLREDIANGGMDEPQSIRDLSQNERTILTNNYRHAKLVYDKLWIIIPLSIFIDIFMGYTLVKGYFESSLIKLYALVAFGEISLISFGLKDKNIYLDLESPVLRIVGEAIKEEVHSRNGTYYYITVRKIKFSDSNYPDLRRIFESIIEGERIEIQYSPRTKRVWSLIRETA